MITDIICAFLGIGSKLYTSVGGQQVSGTLLSAWGSLYTNEIKAYIQRFISLFYYFFPKEVVTTIMAVFVSIIVIRIILAIVAEIWFG